MNKTYFAKYLPIEGIIDVHDYFLFDGKIARVTHIEKAFIQIMYEGQLAVRANFDKCKKVKLFLCSRDNPDKPLGEISGRAKWVKENDEFIEEEIGVLWNFVGEDSDEELFTLNKWPEAVKQWYRGKIPSYMKKSVTSPQIAVKCPCCGTFM